MDDNTMGMMQDLIAAALDNAINASRFETLVNMLLDGASLTYNGNGLQVGNDSAIMAFIEAVRYSDYADALKALQKKKEEEDALKALQKQKEEKDKEDGKENI